MSHRLVPMVYSSSLSTCLNVTAFGFFETEFVGIERGEVYRVMAGYLSGRPTRVGVFRLALDLTGNNSAGELTHFYHIKFIAIYRY